MDLMLCCSKRPPPPKNGEKLCNSFFLQKSRPGYSKISRSLAVSTDYFLSVELHCSNICLCKRTRASTCEVWLLIAAGGEHLSGKRHCSLAAHMLGLLTKQCGKTRRTTSQKKVCKLDFRTVPLSRFELY